MNCVDITYRTKGRSFRSRCGLVQAKELYAQVDHYVLKGANLSNELEYRKEAILLTGYAILSSISVLALSELAVMEKFLFTLQSMLRTIWKDDSREGKVVSEYLLRGKSPPAIVLDEINRKRVTHAHQLCTQLSALQQSVLKTLWTLESIESACETMTVVFSPDELAWADLLQQWIPHFLRKPVRCLVIHEFLREQGIALPSELSLSVYPSASAPMFDPHRFPVNQGDVGVIRSLVRSGGYVLGRYELQRHVRHGYALVHLIDSPLSILRRYGVEDIAALWRRLFPLVIRTERERNRAWHGDIVLVRINAPREWIDEGTRRRGGVLDMFASDEEEEKEPPAAQGGWGEEALEWVWGSMDEEEWTTQAAVAHRERFPAAVVTGRVVGIVQTDATEIIARLDPASSEESLSMRKHVMAYPLDPKFPKLRVPTRQAEQLRGKYAIIRRNDWGIHDVFPAGNLQRVLAGDPFSLEGAAPTHEDGQAYLQVSLQALMWKHRVVTELFSTAACARLPLRRLLSRTSAPQALEEYRLVSAPRRDIRRTHRVFSVDPVGCQDIDDAMSVLWVVDKTQAGKSERLRVEVAVHIADVTQFVSHRTALDAEAQRRGTTVYMPHQRVDMLPSLLSSDLASLHSGVDRWAVSVAWNIELSIARDRMPSLSQDDVLDDLVHWYEEGCVEVFPFCQADSLEALAPCVAWMGRTWLHNVCAMTYHQAEALLLQQCEPETTAATPGRSGQTIPSTHRAALRCDLQLLTVVSRELMRLRYKQGALNLTQESGGKQLRFRVDYRTAATEARQEDDTAPLSVRGFSNETHAEIHDTIAELMIWANSTVAAYNYHCHPQDTLLRCHPPPSTEKLTALWEYLQASPFLAPLTNAFAVEGGGSGAEPSPMTMTMYFVRNYRSILKSVGTPQATNEFVTALVIGCMSEATYECSGSLLRPMESTTATGYIAEETDERLRTMRHMGLGLVYYTHFTSPIRRYADVVVHKQLLHNLSCFGLEKFQGGDQPGDAAEPVHAPTGEESVAVADASLEDLLLSVEAERRTPASAIDDLDDLLASLESGDRDHETLPLPAADSLLEALDILRDPVEEPQPRSESAAPAPPQSVYTMSELDSLARHLNERNRSAKQLQTECQQLFLWCFYSERSEELVGVVACIDPSAVRVYIPRLDTHVALSMEQLRRLSCPGSWSSPNTLAWTNQPARPSATASLYDQHKSLVSGTDATQAEYVFIGNLPRDATGSWRTESTWEGMLRATAAEGVLLKRLCHVLVAVRAQPGSLRWQLEGQLRAVYTEEPVKDTAQGTEWKHTAFSAWNKPPQLSDSSDVGSAQKTPYEVSQQWLKGRVKATAPSSGGKRVVGIVRCQIPRTTRLAFGTLPTSSSTEEEEAIPWRFVANKALVNELHGPIRPLGDSGERKSANHKLQQVSNTSEHCVISSLGADKRLAKERMLALGEEWAEEEDLPEDYSEDTEHSSTFSEDIIVSKKDMNSIMSRQTKLKIAKRRSKLEG